MNLDAAIAISGDSKLRSVTFDGSLLTLHLENFDDEHILIQTKVSALISDRSECRVCHLGWDDLSELDTQHGIWVPPRDFGKLMQQVRKGRQLAFGRRRSPSSGLLCVVGECCLLAFVESREQVIVLFGDAAVRQLGQM
ncbi:MAG: hypothetical protein H6718_30780 [Polyangiaceae bacterium]|nr:hypothetical protein [Polyangiaceae bacterium]